jgi:hypothetical protein
MTDGVFQIGVFLVFETFPDGKLTCPVSLAVNYGFKSAKNILFGVTEDTYWRSALLHSFLFVTFYFAFLVNFCNLLSHFYYPCLLSKMRHFHLFVPHYLLTDCALKSTPSIPGG